MAKVYLVGTGPGDPTLLTLRGRNLLARADVLIFDRLVPQALLVAVPDTCQCISVGKKGYAGHVTQDEINAILVEQGRRADVRTVVRLKGGDPFVFGRGGEEAAVLARAGVSFEVVPAVTAATAAAAYAGIPVTERGIASQLTLVTGNEDPLKDDAAVSWEMLARDPGTLCLYMSVRRLPQITERLLAGGMSERMPVAVVERAACGRQRVVCGVLGGIVEQVERERVQAPALVIIGRVVKRAGELSWFEDLPLFGHTVMVTRAKAQAPAFVSALTRRGAEVVCCPVLEMHQVADAVCDEALMHLGSYDWVVLTSARAVGFFFERLFSLGMDARALASVRVATIGTATAAALRAGGVSSDLVPPSYHSRALAEALLDTGLSAGARVLCPRARIASDVLPSVLRAAGVRCDVVTLYETVVPACNAAMETGIAALKEGDVDAVTFTSPSSVRNLVELLDGDTSALTGVDLFSIGPVTTQELQCNGLVASAEAEVHTVPGLVEALERYYGEAGQAHVV